MALDIQLADEGSGRRRVRLTGRLDTVTAPEPDTRLAAVLADPAATAVVFDLAALEYISSAGIRSIVKARKALEGRRAGLVLLNLQPPVHRLALRHAEAQPPPVCRLDIGALRCWSRPRSREPGGLETSALFPSSGSNLPVRFRRGLPRRAASCWRAQPPLHGPVYCPTVLV